MRTSQTIAKWSAARSLRTSGIGLLVFACALCASPAAWAGTQTGTISQIMVRASDGLHYFFMSGPATGKPGCATGTYWMIRDEQSDTGKHQFAMLLAAHAAGTEVIITGTNTCTRWVNGEDVNMVRII